MEPIVYIVTDPDGKDLSTARKFGKFHVILTGRESTQEALDKLYGGLFKFRSCDYLLPIGKSINMGLAIHMAWCSLDDNTPEMEPVDLNILVWRRQQQDYTVEKVTI